jgi:ribosomal protein S13
MRKASEAPLPGGNFRLFTTRLSFQAMISLGLLENPLTKTRRIDLDSARMLIEDLKMLREKTLGNLEEDEEAQLEKSVRDLEFALAKVSGRAAGESADEA